MIDHDKVHEIIKDEFEKASQVMPRHFESLRRSLANSEIGEEIAEAMFAVATKNNGRLQMFSALEALFRRFKFDKYDAHDVFELIEQKLTHFIDGLEDPEVKEEFVIRSAYIHSGQPATNYFRADFFREVQDLDLPAALAELKWRLNEYEEWPEYRYHRAALDALIKDLETAISIGEEEDSNRTRLGTIASEQTSSPREELKKHQDARLDRVVLALNYLLDAAGVSQGCQKSKRINIIDFLSPYSRNTTITFTKRLVKTESSTKRI